MTHLFFSFYSLRWGVRGMIGYICITALVGITSREMLKIMVVIDGHPTTHHTLHPNEVKGVPWMWDGSPWAIILKLKSQVVRRV